LRTVPNREENKTLTWIAEFLVKIIIGVISFLASAFLIMAGVNIISPAFGLPNLDFPKAEWLLLVVWLLGCWWNRSVAAAAANPTLKFPLFK
jgi:hypothetical protein